MTSSRLGRLYVEEARGRVSLVRLALDKGLWAATVREAQECVDQLATISTDMAGDRGIAFNGDERQELGPQELFDERDAQRAVRNLEFVASLCERLLSDSA